MLSELTNLIRVLMAQKKFRDAKQLLDETLTSAFIEQPSSADFLVLRVDLEARRGQWQEAAVDAVHAMEHEPLHYTRFPIVAALLVKSVTVPPTNNSARGFSQRSPTQPISTLLTRWRRPASFFLHQKRICR